MPNRPLPHPAPAPVDRLAGWASLIAAALLVISAALAAIWSLG